MLISIQRALGQIQTFEFFQIVGYPKYTVAALSVSTIAANNRLYLFLFYVIQLIPSVTFIFHADITESFD
jgi:hypothetical protein